MDDDLMLPLLAGMVAAAGLGVFFYIRSRKVAGGSNESGAGAGGGVSGDSRGRARTESIEGGIPLTIWYGSQTGTAETFAKTLASESKRHGFSGKAVDLEEFTPESVQGGGKVAIFTMATYGEGDPTDNAIEFHTWLTSDERGDGDAAGLKFSVFGLGNRQYEHYNKMGKVVDKGLEKLGGTRVYKHGEGDDDAGTMEEDFEEWKGDLWAELKAVCGAEADEGGAEDKDGLPALPDLGWKVVEMSGAAGEAVVANAGSAAAAHQVDLAHVDLSCKHYFTSVDAKVLVNRELRRVPAVGDSTIHVELDVKAEGAEGSTTLQYGCADNLGILPENNAGVVESLCAQLGYNPDMPFDMEAASSDAKPMFPTPTTVRTALARYCDVTGPLRKACVAQLAHFATDPEQRTRLAALTAREGKAEWHEWATVPQRSLVEVFDEFPSLQPPLEWFLALVPRLQPRYYTIASSPAAHPNRIHIAVSMIAQEKPGQLSGRMLEGVTCHTIQRAEPPASDRGGRRSRSRGRGGGRTAWPTLRVHVRPSTFDLPSDPSLPVVMVGPGTGIAPMRAFLQQRRCDREAGQDVGPTVLFFGCRRREEDFIYEDELLEYGRDGTLDALHTAFSREQSEKVYVQHKLAEEGASVWEMLEGRGGSFYVCGATRMGHDVHAALAKIAVEVGGVQDGEAWVKSLQTQGRYVQELWS